MSVEEQAAPVHLPFETSQEFPAAPYVRSVGTEGAGGTDDGAGICAKGSLIGAVFCQLPDTPGKNPEALGGNVFGIGVPGQLPDVLVTVLGPPVTPRLLPV
jgi:hypothetical protein